MKILQVCEPGLDGVFRQVEALTHSLVEKGHHVSFAYSSKRGSDRLVALVDFVQASGGEVLDLQVGNAPGASDLRALWKLARLIRQVQPDIVHGHSSKGGALTRILAAVMRFERRTFYTPNAYFGLGKSRSAKVSLYNGVERVLGGFCTTINVSSDENEFAREVLQLDPRRLQVINNGVDTQIFTPVTPAEKARLRAAWGIPASARVLGTVGRFSYQKNYATLYRALAAVLPDEPDLHFVHLGARKGCPESEAAARLIPENRVTCIEYLPEPRAIYQLLDGFTISSRYEGLSYAVLEALSCNLPLILSDVTGNRTILRLPLSHGWSAPAEDVDGFARAIRHWRQDLDRVRPCNHREIAERDFTMAGCCRKIEELFTLAAQPRQSGI